MTKTQGDGHSAPGEAPHRLLRMVGRDPNERGRVSSPLELLFDLTVVVAVGTAASQFAEMLAEDRIGPAAVAFVLAMFAITIAWINFSWFASAFSTDDWLDRILTMIQMIGVVVFALGLPAMFHSIEAGHSLDVRAMVVGYVVMRVALVAQWWRVARQSPRYRRVAVANMWWITLIQLGWLAVAFSRPSLPVALALFIVLGILELLLPALTQGSADGTPWHPHHVAERYSLLAIITLGEGVVGTVASSSGLLGGEHGTHWTTTTVEVVVAGVGLTFGMWWVYFATPFGEVLAARRSRGYLFGYGHLLLYLGIAGAGAGLHLAGLKLEHHAELSSVAVVLALAVPVGVYIAMVFVLHSLLLTAADAFHLLLIGLTLLVLLAAVLLAAAGVGTAICLLVVMLAPIVTVVGYETVGHRHQDAMVENLRARDVGP